MDFIKTLTASVVSFVVLFISTKIVGNKQLSELSLFDYINGITIGSIAAEMATDIDKNIFLPLIAIAVYTILVFSFDFISRKSQKASRFLGGHGIVLLEHGKLYKKNFSAARLELSDFLAACRINGYFHLDELESATLEQNGQISFMPKDAYRPVTPSDIKLDIKTSREDIVVISDGIILSSNLKQSGNNEDWLKNQMKSAGISSEKEIFLGICNSDNKLIYYKTSDDMQKNDKIK
ncbi:MAG: DUF421 domain-containing protein [Clostridia bacterium]|nr:DUF421 domain-containing protein [Clostridia bacterium]